MIIFDCHPVSNIKSKKESLIITQCNEWKVRERENDDTVEITTANLNHLQPMKLLESMAMIIKVSFKPLSVPILFAISYQFPK